MLKELDYHANAKDIGRIEDPASMIKFIILVDKPSYYGYFARSNLLSYKFY